MGRLFMLKPNYEAEMSVIGSILLDAKEAMPLSALKLKEDDFKTSELKTIYSACLKLFKSQKSIDVVTVLSVVGDEYKKTAMNSIELVPVVNINHVSAYIDAVKSQAQKIDAYNFAMQFIENIDSGELPVEEYRSEAAQIVSCFNDDKKQEAVSAEEGYMDFLDRMEHPKKHIQTGFGKLDEFMYIDKGDFIIIGGRPSSGKTAFTLQMMLSMAKDKKVGYFSLETSPQKVFDRLVSNYAWTSFRKIKQGNLDDKDWTSITQKYDTFHKLGFEVIPAAGWTVDKIKSYSEIRQYDIVFIDYLTLIRAQGKDDTERTTHISEDLHTFAQQDRTTVIALSQLNRDGTGNLSMTSLRQSGQIEQDADGVILIQYDDQTPEVREIKIVKNKEGIIGNIHASFDGDHQRFSLVETRYEE
jgi:replicative DNA helicase